MNHVGDYLMTQNARSVPGINPLMQTPSSFDLAPVIGESSERTINSFDGRLGQAVGEMNGNVLY